MNMDEDPLCSDGPIDIMLKPKPGLVPHFSCTFRPLQEAVLRHSPQGSPQNSPRLHPHSPRSRCDTPLCPSPTRSHSSMIPNAPLLIRPRAYAHRSRSRSWDDTRESRTAEARWERHGIRHARALLCAIRWYGRVPSPAPEDAGGYDDSIQPHTILYHTTTPICGRAAECRSPSWLRPRGLGWTEADEALGQAVGVVVW